MNKVQQAVCVRRLKISEEIKSALEASGMTKSEFAQKMHRQPSEVTKWLGGNHNFTSDLLAEISQVLGKPISGIERYVDGYNSTIVLNDSFGNIVLPSDVLESLTQRAFSKGLTLRTYILDLLIDDAKKEAAKPSDFCGIWNESFPTAEELRSMRTQNKEVVL